MATVEKAQSDVTSKEVASAQQPVAAADTSQEEIPIIDLSPFMEDPTSPAARAEIEKVARGLVDFGCLVIKDPRVDETHNDTFVDMLEEYFAISDGKRDARPEISYQVGVTPELAEVPRNHCTKAAGLAEGHRPVSLCPPEPDLKMRFFWRIGPQPKTTKYPALNASPVVPPEFPKWADTMDMWGSKMLASLHTLAGMAAVGFDLPPTSFQDLMHEGPHLLAPTGSDFSKYGAVNSVLAGYHYDLNFLTIHGKSRFPGLFVWLKNGKRVPVKVPTGHLIVQAGKQLEHLTAGHVQAGFHEVVVSDATVKTIAERKESKKSLWRVSSTLFGHIASDRVLQPLGHFAKIPGAAINYPSVDCGQHVQDELNAIALGKGATNQTPPEHTEEKEPDVKKAKVDRA